jgi:integrase
MTSGTTLPLRVQCGYATAEAGINTAETILLGEKLSESVQRAMQVANRRAGTEGITPHHLRHAWATYAHANGAPLRDLQEILGHKSIETTARYVRPDPERVISPFESLRLAS